MLMEVVRGYQKKYLTKWIGVGYQEGDVDNKSVQTSFRNRYIFYMYGKKFDFVEKLLLYEFDGVIPSRSNARTLNIQQGSWVWL